MLLPNGMIAMVVGWKTTASPKAQTARDELGETSGRDGLQLLAAVEAAADLPQLRELPALQVLRQLWAEQYTDSPGPITFREKKDLGRLRT